MESKKVSITAISDTHEQHDALNLAPGDILVCTGDITYRGEPFQIQRFAVWMAQQPFKHKILIAGNHDWLFEKNKEKAKEILGPEIIYLQDSSVTVEGLKIYGSPWQPRFFDWAFNADRGDIIQKYWDQIPDDTNVLLTHGPPMGIGDETKRAKDIGCANLRNTIQYRLKKLKLHVFGHVHPGHGTYHADGLIYVNAAICNDAYKPINPAQTVILDVPVEDSQEATPGPQS